MVRSALLMRNLAADRRRSSYHIDAVHPRNNRSISISTWIKWQIAQEDQITIPKIGRRCDNVFQYQHAEQLGICIQHQRACTHHSPQFWKRVHDGSWLVDWKTLLSTASHFRVGIDGGCVDICVGRCALESTRAISF